MGLCSAQVTSRSNSDGLTVQMIGNNTSMSPAARMAAILKVAQAWDNSTQGTSARYGAERELSQREANKTVLGSL